MNHLLGKNSLLLHVNLKRHAIKLLVLIRVKNASGLCRYPRYA